MFFLHWGRSIKIFWYWNESQVMYKTDEIILTYVFLTWILCALWSILGYLKISFLYWWLMGKLILLFFINLSMRQLPISSVIFALYLIHILCMHFSLYLTDFVCKFMSERDKNTHRGRLEERQRLNMLRTAE